MSRAYMSFVRGFLILPAILIPMPPWAKPIKNPG
ncbi:hypothetical protein H4W00_001020 [Psychrobacter sp. PL19]